MKGKHPADVCPNAKAGLPSCHGCGGNCTCGGSDNDLVSEITKKVIAALGK